MTSERHWIVAFHFDADHPGLGSAYGYKANREVFRVAIGAGFPSLNSFVFVGDLLLHELAAVARRSKVWNPYGKKAAYCDGEERTYPKGKRLGVAGTWLSESSSGWTTLHRLNPAVFLNMNIYVVCFRAMPRAAALELSEALEMLPYFLGAIEINETAFVHRYLYLKSLVMRYHVRHKRVYEVSDIQLALIDPETIF